MNILLYEEANNEKYQGKFHEFDVDNLPAGAIATDEAGKSKDGKIYKIMYSMFNIYYINEKYRGYRLCKLQKKTVTDENTKKAPKYVFIEEK